MTDWSLVYQGYDPEQEGRRETLCALGNGYLVTRGAAPDSAADGVHYPGTYLAGGYDRQVTTVVGRQVENEDLVNLPNWLVLTVRIGGDDWMSLDAVELLDYRQELDLRQGMLLRTLRLRDAAGRTTRWQERRIVGMHDKHVAGLSVRVTPEDWSGRMTVCSALDGSVVNRGVERYRDLQGRHLETVTTAQTAKDVILLRSRMIQSLREVAEAARTQFFVDGRVVEPARSTECTEDRVAEVATLDVTAGSTVQIEKLVAVYASGDAAISEPGLEAADTVAALGRFDDVLGEHRLAWMHLWEECDLQTWTSWDQPVNLELRLHIFHLLQTVSYNSIGLDVGVPPRGWHGEAYRAHIMWDELYIFPFLTLRIPVVSRALLQYRFRRLPQARQAARAAGYKGAMFPWQSGSNGREESQEVHLNPVSGRWVADNSRRQRHIGAAIAYNVWQYYQATDDQDFLFYYGAELLLEIARFWASIASRNPSDGRYDIRGVMGPDEFHTAYPGKDPVHEGGLDNNAYTNVMASWTLARALDVLALLPDERCRRLRETIGLGDDEVRAFGEVSRTLRIPFHGDGIISQFQGYENLRELDWEAAHARYGDIRRLDRILEAQNDTPNNYKVSKQADTLMLFYLFSEAELTQIFERLGYHLDHAAIRKTIDYYMERTTHGSTLSLVTHSWVLARYDRSRSGELFRRALRSDIDDIQSGTTSEGIHLGAMASSVDIMQRCYTGLEARGNVLHIDPRLPAQVQRLTTHIRYRRQILDLDIDHETLRISSRPFTSAPVTVAYRGELHEISPGQHVTFHLVPPGVRRA